MKKKYNLNRLSKKQRHMKKWIPDGFYCHGMGEGKHPNSCPFWHDVWDEWMKDKIYNHNRSECQFGKGCEEDCSVCDEPVAKCSFLNYIEYGQYPLGDMCKVCGIHEHFGYRRW